MNDNPTLPELVAAARKRWPGRFIVCTEGTDGIAWSVAVLFETKVDCDMEPLLEADSRAELMRLIESAAQCPDFHCAAVKLNWRTPNSC